MNYTPQPIDTKTVELSPELNELTERLAENVHDVWAQGRIKDGWSYGPIRNDANKTTPCLVPYNELPDSEKEYDRQTAQNTLKAILALGFQILPPDGIFDDISSSHEKRGCNFPPE